MTQSPCYKCPDRTMICHSPGECEKYMKYRKEREELSQTRKAHIGLEEYFINSTRKAMKQTTNRR